jgi:hypothetical protein
MVDKGTLDQCQHGTGFPARRKELVDRASANRCPSEALIALVDLPERVYLSEDDVLCQLGDTAYCAPPEEAARPPLRRVPEAAGGQGPLAASARPPGRATKRTTIILAVAAVVALAIVLWAVVAAVISQ